nr:peptidoglycan DD-metalloendopeptidase family protein [Parvularcula dongshanensis]
MAWPFDVLSALPSLVLWAWAGAALVRLAFLAGTVLRLRRVVAKAVGAGGYGVFASAEVDAPIAAFGRIVVPQDFGRAPAARLVLAHERAHLRRGDPRFFFLLSAVRAVLWHDPFFVRQADRCRLAAEIACDAAALEGAATERRSYAEALLLGLKHAAGTALHGGPAAFPPRNLGDHRMRMTHILRPSAASGKRRPLRSLALGVAVVPATLAVAIAGAAQGRGLSVVPTQGELTSAFGPRTHPIVGEPANHRGIDIAAPRGTPVSAAGGGRVTQAGEQGAYGLTVVIDHGAGLLTRYAQLDAIDVQWNEDVAAGQRIGAVGSSGQSTGPHLHFEVRRDGEWVDPAGELDIAR